MGNLKKYSFEEIKNELSNTQIEIIEKNNGYFWAKFSDQYTEFVIRFNLDGKYITIEYEYWKDLDVKFQNNRIIYGY